LKLYEYETKNILQEYGIHTPKGKLAANTSQARDAIAKIKPPLAAKAQVLIAGRGKTGGILFANSVEEAVEAAERLLKARLKGIPVKKLLIEEKLPIKKELYFGITIDRANRSYVAIASTAGGVDFEDVAVKTPEAIWKTLINPQRGLCSFDAEQIAKKMGYNGEQRAELARVLEKLYQAGMDYDAELIEINPLVETAEGKFVAADARLIMDDNALFRHPDYERRLFTEERENSPREIEAMKHGIAYVKLDGDIGVIGNGAGLVMATLDMVQYYGGRPANFLDLGGGADTERIAVALGILLSGPDVKGLFINILGGMTRCDDVARAILEAKNAVTQPKPVVIRLVGTNEEEGVRILTQESIPVLASMEEAAKRIVEIVKGAGH
jgi:succinyl-CoA synthetase beta subunit